MLTWMKTHPHLSGSAARIPLHPDSPHPREAGSHDRGKSPAPYRQEIRVICLYPTVSAGKLARQWMETAVRETAPDTYPSIEFFNYAVLNHDGISWGHVVGKIRPDVILMLGGESPILGSGLRHSLRELIARGSSDRAPLVIFRDLDPEPSLNTRVLLDYVSALTHLHHCELRAMNGNGTPIESYRHPLRLFVSRHHRE